MEIIVIIILILLNGIFSMSEMALVSARKFKLESDKKKGSSGAKTALDLSENPDKFLSTVQIGITLIGILLGVFSGDALTKNLADTLRSITLTAPYADTLASVLIIVIITYFSIVFGELLPKRLGMTFPEAIAKTLAKPMSILSKVTSPFVWLLSVTNNLLLKIMGIEENNEVVTEEEIKSIIRESTEGGEIQEKEHDIVERVFELGDRRVNTLSTHRSEVVYLNINDTLDQVRNKIKKQKFSGYPIVKNDNLDEVVGVINLKDLFGVSPEEFQLKKYMRKAIFVNENSYSYPLLERLQNSHSHFAVMIDEYGTTAGIVTINDIMDELIGESPENEQEDYEIKVQSDGSWIIDGQYSIYEFERFFDVDVNDDLENLYVTVSGLFFNQSEDMPKIGDEITIDNLVLRITEKDGNRIDKIHAYRIEGAEDIE
ncbi:MAG: HlyC/CorC family transporter [Flavobacteriaceae bacterium]|nr:HlyC/CorC family transporter [Candidatus Onthonaster equi]